MKIGISGAHKTGKTTYLYKLAHDYKIRYPEKKISLISEISKTYFLGEFNAKAQLWMFTTQVCAELETYGDIILVDSTIYDIISYTLEIDTDLAAEMLALSKWMHYDKIFFLRPTGDGERRVDKNLAKIFLAEQVETQEVKIHWGNPR